MNMMIEVRMGVLALLLISAGAGWRYTKQPPPIAPNNSAAMGSTPLVDEGSYTTAQKLAQLATTPEERPYAQSALRIADHPLALAFTSALRDVQAHPPPLSPEALEIQDRRKKS